MIPEGTRARISRVSKAVIALRDAKDGRFAHFGKRNEAIRNAIPVIDADLAPIADEMRAAVRQQRRSLAPSVKQDISAYASRIASVGAKLGPH